MSCAGSTLALLLLLLNCALLTGQQGQVRFLHYSTSDGLPGNGIPVLTTDADGFLWVGTVNGLARYDGQGFVPFNRLQRKFLLPEKDVKLIFPDSRGFLWVRFKSGAYYRINLATFEVTVLGDQLPFSAELEFFPSAVEDQNGDIWFAASTGLAQYRHTTGQLEFFPLTAQGKKMRVIQVCKDKNGILWAGANTGLFRFDPRTRQYEHFPLGDEKTIVAALACDREGFIWLSIWYAETDGLVQFDPAKKQIVRSFSKQAGLLHSTDLDNIFPDGDSLWLATNAGGLSVFDKKQNGFRTFKPDDLDPNSLSSWTVLSVTRDPFGSLWIGTDKFLNQIPANDKTTVLLRHNPYNPQSLVYSKTLSVGAVSNTHVLLGTEQGFSLYDRLQHRFINVHLPHYNKNNYNDNIIGVEPGDAGSCWISTWSGLFRIDKNTGRTLEYFITYNNAGENHPAAVKRMDVGAIHRLHRDKRGDLWLKRYHGKLRMMPRGEGRNGFLLFDTLVRDANPLNEEVFCFAEPDAGGLLIGTADGIVRYDANSGFFQNWPVIFPGLEKPFEIKGLQALKNGDLAVLVNNKVFRIENGDPSRPAVPVAPAFPLVNCIDLIEDDAGSLWVCTETGLAQINLTNNFSFFYSSRHFLHGNTFDIIWPFSKLTKDAAGALYFAGTGGISVVQPAEYRFQKTPPTVKIISLKINNELVSTDSVIHKTTDLTLSSEQNNLTFEFAALNSSIPALNRFAYRVEGSGTDWLELGNLNSVNFSNLSPGKYTLGIKAANSDGVWSDKPYFLDITILPPWYRSTLAWFAYILFLSGSVYYFYRFQLRRKLEQAENEQLKALDVIKTRLYTNITHEFRTPLTVILGVVEQMKRFFDEHAADAHHRAADAIRRNGQNLLTLINQMLDLAKLESGNLQLEPEAGDLVAFLRYVVESFQSYADGKQVNLRFESELQRWEAMYDKNKLQTIVSNLLSNAIKFTPENGEVSLKVGKKQLKNGAELLFVQVKDTGIGISAEQLPHIFDRFFQADGSFRRRAEGTGIGLALVKELVKLMDGDIRAESTPGLGTVFTLEIGVQAADLAGAAFSPAGLPPMPVAIPAPAARPAAENADVESGTDKPLLLLVEDNADVADYVRDCLREVYAVETAANGQAGIDSAFERIPDIIISDVMMPLKDGYELCDTLKNDERTSHIPIVLLTAKAGVHNRIAGLRRGADAFLNKPFHREELFVVLEKLLENRRRLQARYSRVIQEQHLPDATGEPAELAVEDAFLQKLRAIVEDKLSDAEFDMPQLSKAAGMSHSQIFRKLKALTGRSPSAFIRSVRLNHARQLLKTTALTVAEIAYETGFTSPAYFSTMFLEEFGKTPTEAR